MFKKQPINKLFLGFLTPLVAMLFVACTTTGPEPPQQQQPPCAFPDAPKSPAPEWICNQSVVTGALMTALGSGDSSNLMLRLQQCEGTARMSMTRSLESSVKTMFQQHAGSTGSGSTETLDLMSDSVTEQLANAVLRGTSVKKTATSPKGTYYCLMAMEKGKYEAIREAAENAAKTSMGNEQAQWQQFKAQKKIEEMIMKLEAQERKKEMETGTKPKPEAGN